MTIIDLPKKRKFILETAEILFLAFKEDWPDAWSTKQSAIEEVKRSLSKEKISRIAIIDNHVVGWIGGIPQYNGNVWELHPLVVRPDYQHRGIGKQLVQDFERKIKKRGGLVIWLGTDDENHMTTVSDIDLFPNVLEHLFAIKNLRNHPYEFYQKCGFSIVGIIPDANGRGKPDIYMAKKV